MSVALLLVILVILAVSVDAIPDFISWLGKVVSHNGTPLIFHTLYIILLASLSIFIIVACLFW